MLSGQEIWSTHLPSVAARPQPGPAYLSRRGGLIKTGLRDAGYVYMDWLIGYSRNLTTSQVQLSEPERWTGGDLKYVVGWLHSHGFKFSTGLSPDRSSCPGEGVNGCRGQAF